jgi:predicted metal-dependent hydrolase
MATYTYTQPHRLSQLHDEILAAVPATRPVGEGDARTAVMTMDGRGDTVRVTVPDGVSEAEIAAVVAAHQPAQRRRRKEAHEYRAEYAGATSARKLEILARVLGVEAPEMVDE